MKRISFIYSTIILTIANFFVRFLGFIYKIILSRLLGSEGIGLYHLIFHTFLILITITSSGIPVAVSKIIAQNRSLKDYGSCKNTLIISVGIGVSLSLLLSILLFNNVQYIANDIIENSKLNKSIIALIPSLPIVTLSSIFRSYYYGIKNVKPAAASQIIEQIMRIIFVVGLLYIINPRDIRHSVAIATLGITIGELSGLVVLTSGFKLDKVSVLSNLNINHKWLLFRNLTLFKKIIVVSLPITLARLISVSIQSINMFLVPQRLQLAGYNLNQSVSAFGEVVGMTVPLLFLPFTVTSALVVNIIPNISEEMTLNKWKNIEYKSSLALKTAFLVSIPIGFLFFSFANPICAVLYNKPNVGIYLKYLSCTVVFLSLHHIVAGILHGMGKQVITTINYITGMSIHLFCIYFLVANPRFGINGFNIGFILSSFIICGLNFLALKRYLSIKINIVNNILKPVLSSIIMISAINISYKLLCNLHLPIKLDTLVSAAFGGLVYLFFILISGSIKLKTIKYILFSK